MNLLSIAIIAKNEENNLQACLDSLKPLSDDIVVVIDRTSNDKTEQIARKSDCEVYVREFDNFASQKNYAISKCKNDWVFAIDADEVVSLELVKEIKVAIGQPVYSAFRIPRHNYFFGRLVRHTNWSSKDDTHIWLFRKSVSRWEGEVHEEVVVDGKISNLKSPKIHNAYRNVEQFLQKTNQYTTHESRGQSFNYLSLFLDPGIEFLRRYIVHLGFLDGFTGLFLSYLMAIYKVVVLVKVWEIKNAAITNS